MLDVTVRDTMPPGAVGLGPSPTPFPTTVPCLIPADALLEQPEGVGALKAQLTRLHRMHVDPVMQPAVDDGDCCEPFRATLVNQSEAKTVVVLLAVPPV